MDELINKFSTITATTINSLQIELAQERVRNDQLNKKIAELQTQLNNLRKENVNELRRHNVANKQNGNKDK